MRDAVAAESCPHLRGGGRAVGVHPHAQRARADAIKKGLDVAGGLVGILDKERVGAPFATVERHADIGAATQVVPPRSAG